MIDPRGILERLLHRAHLSPAEAEDLCVFLLERAEPAQAGAILAALRAKGETPDEVAGFARAMHRLALRPPIDPGPHSVDIVGTGGDGSGTFNLSTGAALLAAAAGLRVIKHGNRSISSRCGSADVLAELGLPMPLAPHDAARALDELGFTFLFAPHYHPVTARLAPVRRALGVRTIFNLLGPLTNPARPPSGVLGAFSPAAARLMATAMAALPIRRYLVVHAPVGDGTWDEPTPIGPFHVFDVSPHAVTDLIIDPAMLGLPRCSPQDLCGGDARSNAEAIRRALTDTPGPLRDALTLGAALAIQAAGVEDDLRHAHARATAAIADGRATVLLEKLASFTPTPAGEGTP